MVDSARLFENEVGYRGNQMKRKANIAGSTEPTDDAMVPLAASATHDRPIKVGVPVQPVRYLAFGSSEMFLALSLQRQRLLQEAQEGLNKQVAASTQINPQATPSKTRIVANPTKVAGVARFAQTIAQAPSLKPRSAATDLPEFAAEFEQ